LSETSHLLAAQRKFNSESLEINDNECHNNCSEKVAKIWCVLSINCLLDTIELIWLGQQEVEKSDDATLEFSSLISSNGDWGEAFPDDGLANVGSDEKRDTRSKTVSFLKKLIKHEYHESSQEKLSNDQERSD